MALATETVGFVFLTAGIALLFLLREPLRHPEKPGSAGFALTVAGIALWPLALGVNYFVSALGTSIALWNLRLLAPSLIAVGWLVLAVSVTENRPFPRRLFVPLAAYLGIDQLLAWTNSAHHLVLGPETAIDGTVLVADHGAWFWIQAAVNYGLIFGSTVLLTAAWLRSSGLRRKQAAALSLAVIPPAVANLVTIFDVVQTPHDLTPFGLIGTGLLLSWALYGTDVLDIVPIARETAMADMHDAVVTVDDQNRVVDSNRTARALFDVPESSAGLPVASFFRSIPDDALADFVDATDVDTEIETALDGEVRHFSISVSPVVRNGETIARVIVLRDITQLKRRERALEARESELDLLRQVLSRVLRHNIRNELTTIRGNGRLLAETADGPDADRVETILGASETMLAISEKAGQIERIVERSDETVSYDLRRVAERAVDTVRWQYPAVSFTVDGAESASVIGGPGLELAVENLLENAAAYNDADDPRVEVRIVDGVDGSDGPVLTIVDNGPGIPTNEIDVLKDGEETPLAHGSGLGLWLVKWVCDRSGAELAFETGDDGSTVSIRFDPHSVASA